MVSLIVSATLAGQIVARTQRFKLLIFGSMVLLAFGLFLLTNLRADTEFPVLWLWMIVVGLGIGPSFAVFTVLVQNTVAPRMVGVATASLTFFQQIGGTIGLTIAGTALADTLTRELPGRLVANGIPQPMVDQFAAGGQRRSARSTSRAPATSARRSWRASRQPFRPQVEPIIPQIVQAIHEAFAIAIASTFWISIAAAVLAAVFVLFLRESEIRGTALARGADADA